MMMRMMMMMMLALLILDAIPIDSRLIHTTSVHAGLEVATSMTLCRYVAVPGSQKG